MCPKPLYLGLFAATLLCLAGPAPAQVQPCDPNATAETRALLHNLDLSRGDRLIFGHHETTRFMATTRPPGETEWSDVKAVTGQWPGMFSTQMNFAVKFGDPAGEREQIRFAYSVGAPITMAWHMDNPVTGGNNGDLNIDIDSILPGGDNHQKLVDMLSTGADFLETLTDDQGRPIPVIYRPYHEHNLLQAFWWNVATPDQFKQLWRFTVDYFRDTRGLHNLLHAYCPNWRRPMSQGDIEANYLEYYPGDDYVDIFGLDSYGDVYKDGKMPVFRSVVLAAEAHGKVPALAETGVGIGGGYAEPDADPDWYTDLLNVLKGDPITRRFAYTQTWYNKPHQYWVPYAPGVNGYSAFVEFANDPWTAFSDDLPAMYTMPLPGDLDLSGTVDAADIDKLRAQVASGLNLQAYDLNGDGLVDNADVDVLVRDILGTEYGDANLDGQVSDADYTLWADHYGLTEAGWGEGDFNGNGTVTEADYTIWADFYGYGTMGTEVPEPAILCLLSLAGVAAAVRSKRQQRG